MTIKQVPGSVAFDDTNWKKYLSQNDQRIGFIFQNTHVSANMYICTSKPQSLADAIMIKPGMLLMEDIMPGNGELWVKTDTAGTALTVWEKFSE